MEELRYVQMLLAFIKQAHHHPRQNQNLVLMDHSGGNIDAKPNLTSIQDVPRAISTNYFNINGSTSSEITNAGSDIIEAKSALNTYAVENYDIVAKCEKLNLMEVEGPSNCNEFDISQYMSFNVFENTGKSRYRLIYLINRFLIWFSLGAMAFQYLIDVAICTLQ